MVHGWVEVVAWLSLGFAVTCAAVILVDEFVLGNRQQMAIMNVVHPITALYWGPIWLWAYLRYGRLSSQRALDRRAGQLAERGVDAAQLRSQGESVEGGEMGPWHVANAVSHCGAGCTLGDIIGEWLVFATGWTIGSTGTFGPELVLDFTIAWSLGVLFQYFTIVPMRDVSVREGLWLAIRADTLSIVSFQLGLFGWMALSHFATWQPPLPINTATHWWMMQVGMGVGFFTAWPVNQWLIKRGWKEKMDHRKHLAMLVEEREKALASVQ